MFKGLVTRTEALERIWAALADLPTEDDMWQVVELTRKRTAQIRMMADYRSMADNRFEPGDPVLVDKDAPHFAGRTFKAVRVNRRTVAVDLGTSSHKGAKKAGPPTGPTPDIARIEARWLRLAEPLYREARRAHQQLAPKP